MSRRPLIGLTGRRKKGRQIDGVLPTMDDVDVDMYFADYANAVLAAGGVPVHLPVDVAAADVVDRLDGLLLSGGADIAPARYGAPVSPDTEAVEPVRDELEFSLLARACDRELPVLGICRGHQVVNVHAGGTLHQHVPNHAGFELPPTHLLHEVTIAPDSALGELYGERRDVNSLHHQSVDRVGESLRVTATSAEGGVEALEHATLPIVTVQWHPEMMSDAAQDPIFGWLVDACR